MDPRASFIVTSMLTDAIQRGTGRRARALKRDDLAGKTGTTNGPRDAWFSGYNRDLVTTAWVGFDDYSVAGSPRIWWHRGATYLDRAIWVRRLDEQHAHLPLCLRVLFDCALTEAPD